MLTAISLSKRFAGEPPVEAVSAVDFSIEQGQFLAIVGRSGSGKSSLLAMLGGISRPTTGQVLLQGTDQWRLANHAHCDFRNDKVGFVFQFASLLPTLQVIDNVALPALIGGSLTSREAYARARTLLTQVGLSERSHFYPQQLSGGEQRRAAIARALINCPEILLADEPTADLDEETEQDILNLLISVHKAFNLTMVLVTHNMDIAARADRVFRMQGGRIVSTNVREIAAADAPAQPLANHDQAQLVKRMFESSPSQLSRERMRLGEEFHAFIGKLTIVILSILAVIYAANLLIGRYENAAIQQREAAHQAIEDLAMIGLRADVKDVTFGPEHSYIVSIYLRNTTGAQPIYVLAPSMRGFVQVGASWQEVPLKPADLATPKVLKITSTQIYRYILEPNVPNFSRVIPHYMHVRISNEMLVSPSSQPKDDLIERSDNYYIYLKPHNADDAAILTKLKFPGAPPVWIPMPPH